MAIKLYIKMYFFFSVAYFFNNGKNCISLLESLNLDKHLRINMSDIRVTLRLHVSMTSFSPEKGESFT